MEVSIQNDPILTSKNDQVEISETQTPHSEHTATLAPGIAKIKKEFLKTTHDEIREAEAENQENQENQENSTGKDEEEPPRKKQKGQNKHRKIKKISDSIRLCNNTACGRECDRLNCKSSHDVEEYLKIKPKDLDGPCVLYDLNGFCPFGILCRFSKSHIDSFGGGKNGDMRENAGEKSRVLNTLPKDLMINLRKRQVKFPVSDVFIEKYNSIKQKHSHPPHLDPNHPPCLNPPASPSEEAYRETFRSLLSCDFEHDSPLCTRRKGILTWHDAEGIRFGSREKKTIAFHEKLYLAPLTTVGNLPFRRICKQFGADITCGEMAMCTNLLQGSPSEWALMKRHSSEDIFGVQLCGSYPDTMTRCAEMLCANGSFDFIDINSGCPIDLVYNKGAGCALMGRLNRLEPTLRGMSAVMNIPLTLKMRMGIKSSQPIAHLIGPKLASWGVDALTLHGRSREQRYTNSADWKYICDFAKSVAPLPVFGNGDILSFDDFLAHRENIRQRNSCDNFAGVMVARGALIKPWLFTEIKENRHWDISSQERFEILKKFTNYGLEHWGSDTEGVEKTRNFLLEWLSFLYRYVPLGLLEVVPQRMNQRPEAFYGRNDLETLMGSKNCKDWVKITTLLLGPVPDNFTFLPKHKANSYS